jgi:UDPglucose 6-dehydrogenase
MNISIIGVGYLGLTTASVLANSGFRVYALDINSDVVNTIKTGKAHFYEPGLDELVKKAIDSGNLIPTTDYSLAIPDSDISFVCVDTVGLEDGSLSIRSVEAAVKSLSEYMKQNHIVVIKSTVPAGTHQIIKNILDNKNQGKYNYVSKPEFLAEGSAVFDTMFPDRIIIGTDSDFAYQKLYEVFEQVDEWARGVDVSIYTKFSKTYRSKLSNQVAFSQRVLRVSVESAELIKVTSNSFLALKISFANMIGRLADKTGGNVNEIMDGVGADPRIGRDFLYAGLGWGGGCFPKDVKGLIKSGTDHGCDFSILESAYDLNDNQTEVYIQKISDVLGDGFLDSTIGVLGLSFKPGTDDIRLSPSTKLVEKLSPLVKQVRVIDPKSLDRARDFLSNLSNIHYSKSIDDLFEGLDIVVLATEWPEYLTLDFKKYGEFMKAKILVDTRNRLNREEIHKAGFTFISVG